MNWRGLGKSEVPVLVPEEKPEGGCAISSGWAEEVSEAVTKSRGAEGPGNCAVR